MDQTLYFHVTREEDVTKHYDRCKLCPFSLHYAEKSDSSSNAQKPVTNESHTDTAVSTNNDASVPQVIIMEVVGDQLGQNNSTSTDFGQTLSFTISHPPSNPSSSSFSASSYVQSFHGPGSSLNESNSVLQRQKEQDLAAQNLRNYSYIWK